MEGLLSTGPTPSSSKTVTILKELQYLKVMGVMVEGMMELVPVGRNVSLLLGSDTKFIMKLSVIVIRAGHYIY